MAKNDKDRLIGRSKSQTLLRRSGLFRKTGGYSAAPAVIQCLYPLDDDGTISSYFGKVYPGPATGPLLQSATFTAVGTQSTFLLLPAEAITSAKRQRSDGPIVLQGTSTSGKATLQPCVCILILDSSSSYLNLAVVPIEVGTPATVVISNLGVISGFSGNTPVSVLWGSGSPTDVPAGGFFTAGLVCLEDYGAGVGSTSNATLRTTAGYMEGPMPLGGKDICGTAVPQTVLL